MFHLARRSRDEKQQTEFLCDGESSVVISLLDNYVILERGGGGGGGRGSVVLDNKTGRVMHEVIPRPEDREERGRGVMAKRERERETERQRERERERERYAGFVNMSDQDLKP